MAKKKGRVLTAEQKARYAANRRKRMKAGIRERAKPTPQRSYRVLEAENAFLRASMELTAALRDEK